MPHCWIGRLLYESGRLEEAEVHLRRAIEIDSTTVMAWAHLAVIGPMKGGDGDALTMARTAVGLAPRSHFCHYVLGRALMSAQRWTDAVQELAVAIELGGAQTVDALYLLGLASERDGNPAAARSAWRAVMQLQPDHSGANQALRRVDPR